MLVLSRQEDETVVITSLRDPTLKVVVTVNRLIGNRVNLGFEAEKHIRVVRGEIAHEPPKQRPSRGIGFGEGFDT